MPSSWCTNYAPNQSSDVEFDGFNFGRLPVTMGRQNRKLAPVWREISISIVNGRAFELLVLVIVINAAFLP